MNARAIFRAYHSAYRRRLNAGGELNLVSFERSSGMNAASYAVMRAAFDVVRNSGRKPAPTFRHALHYPWNYGPRAAVKA